jgi:diguanylate cyclase (GGDEF)-like protein
MIILAAFALGGTATLSISRAVGILYPIFVYAPSIVSLLVLDYQSDYRLLAVLAIFSMVYVIDASRQSGSDYWEAIGNHQIAEERAELLEQLSITDPLTQLKNRMYFNKRYEDEWKRCNRLKIPLSVMMLDLDHFKHINDHYGHLFGDECLRTVAAELKAQIPRTTDTIARYGGEEFVVLLPDTNLEHAENIADRLVSSIASLQITHTDETITVTCSIGIACTIPNHHMNNQSLLRMADDALYQAKNNGRNQSVTAQAKALYKG